MMSTLSVTNLLSIVLLFVVIVQLYFKIKHLKNSVTWLRQIWFQALQIIHT